MWIFPLFLLAAVVQDRLQEPVQPRRAPPRPEPPDTRSPLPSGSGPDASPAAAQNVLLFPTPSTPRSAPVSTPVSAPMSAPTPVTTRSPFDVLQRFADGSVLVRIQTKAQLVEEGQLTQTTVANRWPAVAVGEVEIWSLRDTQGKPVLIAEIEPTSLIPVVVTGPRNEPPSEDAQDKLNAYVAQRLDTVPGWTHPAEEDPTGEIDPWILVELPLAERDSLPQGVDFFQAATSAASAVANPWWTEDGAHPVDPGDYYGDAAQAFLGRHPTSMEDQKMDATVTYQRASTLSLQPEDNET